MHFKVHGRVQLRFSPFVAALNLMELATVIMVRYCIREEYTKSVSGWNDATALVKKVTEQTAGVAHCYIL